MSVDASYGCDVIELRGLQYERTLRQRAMRYLSCVAERRRSSPRSIMFTDGSHASTITSGICPRQLWIADVELCRLALSRDGHESYVDPIAAEALRLMYEEFWSPRDTARQLEVGQRTLAAVVDQALVVFALAVDAIPLDPGRWAAVA